MRGRSTYAPAIPPVSKWTVAGNISPASGGPATRVEQCVRRTITGTACGALDGRTTVAENPNWLTRAT